MSYYAHRDDRETPLEAQLEAFDKLVRAPLLCTQALLPALKRGPGHIVNMSSMGGFRWRPDNERYDVDYAIMKRLGNPEEIAAAIVFLLSDDASYITAFTIHVDGGLIGN